MEWDAAGLAHPGVLPTQDDLTIARGGSQVANFPFKAAGFSPFLHRDIRGLAFGWGSFVEHNVVEYNRFFQTVATHPEMLRLQCKLLNTELAHELRYDHGVLLNRRPGFTGQNWHSHSYLNEGNRAVHYAERLQESEELGQSLVRTLCYPDGYEATDQAGLKVIAGSHLYRVYSVMECSGIGGTDDEMEQGWMLNKTKADKVTPLEITADSLPPGSIVAILCHSAHAVASCRDRQRWASLFCYRRHRTGPARSRWVSQRFEDVVTGGGCSSSSSISSFMLSAESTGLAPEIASTLFAKD